MNVSSAIVAHHGIVAGIFDDLEIGRIIDEEIPKQGQHKLPHSVVLKSMVLNSLGFNERRMYIFPKFFNNIATEQLLGPGVLPEDLNDDVLGRTLDRIYEADSTERAPRVNERQWRTEYSDKHDAKQGARSGR
jgi:transposase